MDLLGANNNGTGCFPGAGAEYRIFLSHSIDGLNWSSPVSYSDTYSMFSNKPAFACGLLGSPKQANCRIMYQSFAHASLPTWSDYFTWNPGLFQFIPAGAIMDAGMQSFANMKFTAIAGGFVTSFVDNSISNSSLAYRLWDQNEGTQKARRSNSAIKSRQGFGVGWNYVRNKSRYVWREN